MTTFLIGLFTVALVLDCIFLILLVLVQLPKKEAGAGMAFGGAATDALFGAGSGNVLTKITKYATITFFVLTLALAVLNGMSRKSGTGSLLKDNWGASKPAASAPMTAPLTTTSNAPVSAPVTTPTEALAPAPAASTNGTAK